MSWPHQSWMVAGVGVASSSLTSYDGARTVDVRVAPRFSDLMAVLTFDPRNVEHVLKHNFANYPKGHHFTSTFQDPSLAQGIFNVDGGKWREQFLREQRFLTSSWVWKAIKQLNIGRERKLKESIKIVHNSSMESSKLEGTS